MQRFLCVVILLFSVFVRPGWGSDRADIPLKLEDEWGLELMWPDRLVGWEYGAGPPRGWRLAGGELEGTAGATPLVSGFTFGDCEIRFQWSAGTGGACQVRLEAVASKEGPCSGECLTLAFREGAGCGAIARDGQVLHAGQDCPPAAASPSGPGRGWHSAAIQRVGNQMCVLVDGRPMSAAAIEAKTRYCLGLGVSGAPGRFRQLRVQEPVGTAMFTGKDLQGWWTPGALSAWHFENGTLVLRGLGGNYLRSRKEYGNFTLSLEYRIQKGGNSGIGIRTPAAGWPSTEGMELQIWDVPADRPLDKHAPMAIYGNVPPLGRADRSGQWNRLVIKADGPMVSAWVNGRLVQHCNTAWHPELKHRFGRGWIGIQDHGARIEVRQMHILEAPEGDGPRAWRTPPADALARLLDRVMNFQELARPDGIRSHVAAARTDDAGSETVLADLQGPGALVRIARTSDEGTLAFFFDGQSVPAVKCRPAELFHVLPHLTEDSNPLVTCVAFRQRLRLVLRHAKRAEYRLNYVTFPPDLPVATWSAADSGVPPGWLAAISYRREQFGWGVHREHDPYRRVQAQAKSIAPGKSQVLIHLEGAGVVRWVKLLAEKKVLDTRDLWLEAYTDGRSEPDVATPVRYWFPGLAGQGNYQNFVLVDRGGVTNMLAMPFSQGIKLALANHGSRPIGNVGLAVSVDTHSPVSSGSPANQPMRLCAVYCPAGSAGLPCGTSVSGAGRWIGLVCETRGPTVLDPASLAIDGQNVAGWAVSDGGLFFGRRGDFRTCCAGRRGGLAWRYLLLEAVDFEKSFTVQWPAGSTADQLVIYYLCEP